MGNILRRNRRHLKRTPESPPELDYSISDDEITDSLQKLPQALMQLIEPG